MRRRRSGKRKKRGGGLCAWLARKHHWTAAKKERCINKASRRHRGRRRRSSRSSSYRYNPWAVCYSQGLKKGTSKYERCVKHVKAQNRRSSWFGGEAPKRRRKKTGDNMFSGGFPF